MSITNKPHFLVLFVTIATVLNRVSCNVPPTFTHFQTPIFLPENTPVGTNITWLQASGAPGVTLSFSIANSPASTTFTLVPTGPTTAIVLLATKLNRQAISQYSIIFQLTDNINVPISRTFMVYVTAVNDQPPSFTNLPNSVSISEDSPVGTSVYDVQATDPNSGLLGTITFYLTNDVATFSIDPVSGVVTLSKQLSYAQTNAYQLQVLAQDGAGLNVTAILSITVTPSQARPPYFINLPYSATVLENATIGTLVLQVTAIYANVDGSMSPLNYSFVSGTLGLFTINSSNGWISVSTTINREDQEILMRQSQLQTVVQATVVGGQSTGFKTAWALVTINIVDINDQAPIFDQPSYNATVTDSSAPGSPLIINNGAGIKVVDTDQGNNSQFSVSLQSDTFPVNVLSVNPSSALGEAFIVISVLNTSALRRLSNKTFNMQIIAQESLTSVKLSSLANITLYVQPANCFTPVFSSSFYTASISATATRGTYVTNVTASEMEFGYSEPLRYSLVGQTNNLFNIDAVSGTLTLAVNLNQTVINCQMSPVIVVGVMARDVFGSIAMTSVQVSFVVVANDTPVFTQASYAVYLPENSTTFSCPLFVAASIPDCRSTAKISYSLQNGGSSQYFNIDNTTGQITVAKAIDSERMATQSISITVIAVTSAFPPFNASVLVTVIIQDVNDQAPLFSETQYFVSIPETTPPGTLLLRVNATDADTTSTNNQLTYRILFGAKDQFLIDPTTGNLTVAPGTTLDLELYPSSYNIIVIAVDNGCPQLTGSAKVNVVVTGVNNKAPTFTTNATYVVSVRANVAVDTAVVVCSAVDADSGSLLRYGVVNGSVVGRDSNGLTGTVDQTYIASLFAVNSTTGSVYVVNSLSKEPSVAVVSFNVFVQDVTGVNPAQQMSTANVTIIILPPSTTSASQFLTLLPSLTTPYRFSETTPPGSTLLRLVAFTSSSSSSSLPQTPVSYWLISETSAGQGDTGAGVATSFFNITDPNRHTGIITLAKPLDCLGLGTVNLTVVATTGLSQSPGSMQGLGNQSANGSVGFNQSMSSVLSIVVVIDSDCGDVPAWTDFSTSVLAGVNSSVGTALTTVAAVSRCPRSAGSIVYDIVSVGVGEGGGSSGRGSIAGLFAINNATGVLSLTGSLSSQSVSTYNLIISASFIYNRSGLFSSYDFTSPYDAINGSMTISINNVNNNNNMNPPTFDRAIYTVQVNTAEIVAPTSGGASKTTPTKLVTVHATDTNSNTLITYLLGSYNVTIAPPGAPGFAPTPLTVVNSSLLYFYVQPITGDLFLAAGSGACLNSSLQYVEANIQVMAIERGGAGSSPLIGNATVQVIFSSANQSAMTSSTRMATPGVLLTSATKTAASTTKTTATTVGYQNMNNSESVGGITGEGVWVTGSATTTPNQLGNGNTSSTSGSSGGVGSVGYFTKSQFTLGITPDTQIDSQVIQLNNYLSSSSTSSASQVSYRISSPFSISSQSMNAEIGQLNVIPFTVGQSDGIVRTNIFFQTTWTGYFQFSVSVSVSSNSVDSYVIDNLSITVFLLNDSQRVQAVFAAQVDRSAVFLLTFPSLLTNLTNGATCFVGDFLRTHVNTTTQLPDPTKTDLLMYAVDTNKNVILDATDAINLIWPSNSTTLNPIFQSYNILSIIPLAQPSAVQSGGAQSAASSSVVQCWLEENLMIALVVVACVLAIFIIAMVTICCVYCHKYKRKLRSANAIAMEPDKAEVDGNKVETSRTKSTRIERSNPIWLEQCRETCYLEFTDSSGSSLDDNAVESHSSQRSSQAGGQESTELKLMTPPLLAPRQNSSRTLQSDSADSDVTKRNMTGSRETITTVDSILTMRSSGGGNTGAGVRRLVPPDVVGIRTNGDINSSGQTNGLATRGSHHESQFVNELPVCDMYSTNV